MIDQIRHSLCIGLILQLCLAATGYTQTIAKSSVRVYVFDDSDKFYDSMGSGTLLTPTQVITNYHVIKDRHKDDSIEIRFYDGERRQAKVQAEDKVWDLALLQIEPYPKVTPPPIGRLPSKGDHLYIAGFGQDYEYKVQKGVLEGYYAPKTGMDGGWMKIDNTGARNGDSGGPISNTAGQWVGTLFGSIQEGDIHTYGTHVSRIKIVFGDKIKLGSPYDNYILSEEKPDGK